jgi:hypothetical protein
MIGCGVQVMVGDGVKVNESIWVGGSGVWVGEENAGVLVTIVAELVDG